MSTSDPGKGQSRREGLLLDRGIETGVPKENGFFQVLEFTGGLYAQFLAEDLTGTAIGAEGVRLAPHPVEGTHQTGPCPLPERIFHQQALGDGLRLFVVPGGEVGFDEFFHRPDAKGFEAVRLQTDVLAVGQALEGVAPPHPQCPAESDGGLGRRTGSEMVVSGVDESDEVRSVEQ